MGGSKHPQSAVSDKSGYSSRRAAACCSASAAFQRPLLFQKADGFERLGVGTGRLAQVCGVTVGVAVDLVAHLLDSLLGAELADASAAP